MAGAEAMLQVLGNHDVEREPGELEGEEEEELGTSKQRLCSKLQEFP